ncbi:hypothetical protein PIB30_036082 [Stylosanthes scabra]|uniref:Uncharacterized protein n=1 Tax=Stylosanthes scabra TaxID=79078 RepID=A0ABU6SEA3_9FABA|nr:hypothetical protein [Stylosanthes scabra]
MIGSEVVFYNYEAYKEYDDIDIEPTIELGTIKIRRYHFEDKKFNRSMHSGRFDPNRPYEFPIAMLGKDCSLVPRGLLLHRMLCHREKNFVSLGFSLQTYPPYTREAVPTWSLPSPSFGFIASSEERMCKDDETRVEETQGLGSVKSEGSKGKELI